MLRRLTILAAGGALVLAGLAGPADAQSRLQRLNPFNRGARPPPLTTFMPDRGFEEWVAANLDIRSFNSSMDNRREAYQARLRELGYEPVPRRGRGPVVLTFTSAEGEVTMSLFERGDLNRDGIEDVLICFQDRLKGSRYDRTQALLAQKYTPNGPLAALDVQVTDPRCREG